MQTPRRGAGAGQVDRGVGSDREACIFASLRDSVAEDVHAGNCHLPTARQGLRDLLVLRAESLAVPAHGRIKFDKQVALRSQHRLLKAHSIHIQARGAGQGRHNQRLVLGLRGLLEGLHSRLVRVHATLRPVLAAAIHEAAGTLPLALLHRPSVHAVADAGVAPIAQHIVWDTVGVDEVPHLIAGPPRQRIDLQTPIIQFGDAQAPPLGPLGAPAACDPGVRVQLVERPQGGFHLGQIGVVVEIQSPKIVAIQIIEPELLPGREPFGIEGTNLHLRIVFRGVLHILVRLLEEVQGVDHDDRYLPQQTQRGKPVQDDEPRGAKACELQDPPW
mmetsp:Transcript_116623/g.370960  ORF Transcript_116623/g.370960 Transcript_116623/m.370960 type:complete len:331 (+) Transcript_116623:123-1115(+)